MYHTTLIEGTINNHATERRFAEDDAWNKDFVEVYAKNSSAVFGEVEYSDSGPPSLSFAIQPDGLNDFVAAVDNYASVPVAELQERISALEQQDESSPEIAIFDAESA